jgi:hypothetical protein
MFDRFLELYQLVFLMLPVSSVYLIGTLQFSDRFKIVLLTYFKVYCSYTFSELGLFSALAVSASFLTEELTSLVSRYSVLRD